MACRFEVLLDADDAPFVPAAREALDEIARAETRLSVFREDSEVAELNRCAGPAAVPVSSQLFDLLQLSRDICADTGGAFDVTSLPLTRCWGFLAREPRLPSEQEIADARARVGMDALELIAETRTVGFRRPGVELNFGSIGKGFALDRAAGVLREAGVGHALLSGGGSSVLALGGRDGGFLIDVASPLVPDRPLARLRLRSAALGTSGAGIQSFEASGRRFGHVLDPRTGWPASGVRSASVVAPQAALADALSTAFLIGGCQLAERYCAAHPGILAFVTEDDGDGRTRVFGSSPGAKLEAEAA